MEPEVFKEGVLTLCLQSDPTSPGASELQK